MIRSFPRRNTVFGFLMSGLAIAAVACSGGQEEETGTDDAEVQGDFCSRVLCGPGKTCNAKTKKCERPFCPTAFCGPGTECNEETRKCEPLPPFCATVFCAPGSVCDEGLRRCVDDEQ